jgi:hypothetical protein
MILNVNSIHGISFKLRAQVRGQEVTPDTIPLGQFNRFNSEVEQLIVGSLKDVPLEEIHAKILPGSYVLEVELPSVVYAALRSDLDTLEETGLSDGIDPKRIEILNRWQEEATASADLSYELSPAWRPNQVLRIDRDHRLLTPEPLPVWFAIEKYLRGEMTNAGGTTQPNLHLRVPGYPRTFTVAASRGQLKGLALGRLYEDLTVHVRGEERLDTGEFRNLELIEFIDHSTDYDEAYLEALIEKGTRRWADVPDANAWLRELRGAEDED